MMRVFAHTHTASVYARLSTCECAPLHAMVCKIAHGTGYMRVFEHQNPIHMRRKKKRSCSEIDPFRIPSCHQACISTRILKRERHRKGKPPTHDIACHLGISSCHCRDASKLEILPHTRLHRLQAGCNSRSSISLTVCTWTVRNNFASVCACIYAVMSMATEMFQLDLKVRTLILTCFQTVCIERQRWQYDGSIDSR
jgi:hypothetical protein